MPSTIEYIFIEADYELKCNRYFYYININSNCYCGLVLNWVFPIGKWILLGDFIVSMLCILNNKNNNNDSMKRGQSWRGGTKCDCKLTGCGFDPQSRRWNIYLNLYFHFFALVSRTSAALSSATQHAMPPKYGRKWGTECLNTRFPLPPLQCAGYSVKIKKT